MGLSRKICIKKIRGKELTKKQKKIIDAAVEKVVKEYGEVFKLLGKE